MEHQTESLPSDPKPTQRELSERALAMSQATQRERMRVLRSKHVRELTGLDDVTIWRLESQGLCPRRFKLQDGGTSVGWLQGEWLDWIAERAAERVTLKAPKREAAAA